MLADTAQLAVVLTLRDQLSGGLTAAQAKLSGLEASATAASVGGMSRLQKAAGGIGTALSHAGSQIGGLVKNVGMLVGGAGLFTLGGALEQGITKAETMALAVEKLTGVTGLSSHTASQLIAVMEKYGVETGKGTTMAAFAEKTLGKLSETQGKAAKSAALLGLENTKLQIQSQGGKVAVIDKAIAEQKATDALTAAAAGTTKLAALDTQFGLHLVDTKGKVVDFATELGQLADFYTSNASASDKAAVAAQLLGRGYVALIPLLKLGSKGLAEAMAAADAMGLTLKTAQDVTNVQAFIAAQRNAKEAIAGLEVQLGLLVMPDLATAMTAFTGTIHDHLPEIKRGFQDVLHFAEQIGGAFTNVVIPAIQMIGGVWNSLPGPFKELLIGGFLANKAVKWTFGIDVAGMATKALGGAIAGWVSNMFKGATTAAMNVEAGVVNVAGGGLPGGGIPGGAPVAAAGAAEGGAALGIGGILAIAGSLVGILASPFILNNLAKTMNPTNDPSSPWGHTGGPSRAPKGMGPADIAALHAGGGGSAGGGTWAYGLTQAQINATRAGERSTVTSHMLSAQISDALKGTLGASNLAQANALTSAFKESTSPSLHSMVSALNQDKAMQAKYLAQGDTKLAASIAANIKYLAGRIDIGTAVLRAKQFTVSGGTGGNVGGDPYPPAPKPGKLGPPAPGPGRVGPGANSPLGITVVVHPAGSTARDNKQAAVIKGRWGPTIAGGQAVVT